MELAIEMYKGIHPGIILERELKKRNLKKRSFALSLQEYPQTLNNITKGITCTNQSCCITSLCKYI